MVRSRGRASRNGPWGSGRRKDRKGFTAPFIKQGWSAFLLSWVKDRLIVPTAASLILPRWVKPEFEVSTATSFTSTRFVPSRPRKGRAPLPSRGEIPAKDPTAPGRQR